MNNDENNTVFIIVEYDFVHGGLTGGPIDNLFFTDVKLAKEYITTILSSNDFDAYDIIELKKFNNIKKS